MPPGDPRLFTYEGVLPGFRAVVEDPWEQGSPAWGRWLAAQGVDVPANPHELYEPMAGFPGGGDHGSTWAPARFPADLSQTTFVRRAVVDWLEPTATSRSSSTPPSSDPTLPGATRSAITTSTRPRRSAPSSGAPPPRTRRRSTLGALAVATSGVGAPHDERERRQLRATYYGAQREVDDGLGQLFGFLVRSGLAESTLVVVTSDHGEMGGDHWLLEKLGYWDESYHVPLIVVDPRPEADGAGGVWSRP